YHARDCRRSGLGGMGEQSPGGEGQGEAGVAGECSREDGREESGREESDASGPGKKNEKTQTPRNSEKVSTSPAAEHVKNLKGAVKREMLTAVQPMLAVSTEEPFNGKEWLFEIKWDGYRAVSFIQNGNVRLVSRNQNDLTAQFSELK